MGEKKMRKYNSMQKVVSISPFLFILTALILHLTLPSKTFSIEERRYLAQWPDFYIENVLNGSYETKVETYFSDQFPYRNFWLYIHESSNRVLLKK